MKLIEGCASKIRVPAGERDTHVWDSVLPGFGIRKFAPSNKAYFVVKYAVGTQQRKLSLGPVLPGTYNEKRRQAAKILTASRLGQDVVADKRVARVKKTVTCGEVVRLYLRSREPELRAATYVEISRYLERYWQPLHAHPVESIDRREIVRVLDMIADGHGRVSVDRARTALSAFFAWLIDRGYLDLNPVQNISRRASGVARSRVLNEAELIEVWRECGDDDYGRIVRLLILTGQRKSEIGDLAWSEIDLDRRQLELPPERTKNEQAHLVPLSDDALAILKVVTRHEGRSFLFGQGSRGFQGWSRAKAALDERIAQRRAGSKQKPMPPWTLHDIRRSVVTHLHERGYAQPHVVEALVNHVSGHRAGVAGIYNKALYSAERRKALDMWGAYFAETVAGRQPGIIPLRAAN
jgi:integrase